MTTMRDAPTSVLEPPPRPAAPPVSVVAETRRKLLGVARTALAVATGRATWEELERELARDDGGERQAGAFVTLTDAGRLRGCMGSLDPRLRLAESVAVAALDAALDDPRFLPLRADELPAIHVDVSVLGRPAPIDGPGSFRPGLDGVIVEGRGRRAFLLPEVATEFSWGATEMFDAACGKAGLPAGAWCEPGIRLSAFRTARFGGPAIATRQRPVDRGGPADGSRADVSDPGVRLELPHPDRRDERRVIAFGLVGVGHGE